MRETPYYSIRAGINKLNTKLDLVTIKDLFVAIYNLFLKKGYFQEHFGYTCVDSGKVDGKLGSDIESVLFIKLRKRNLWPIDFYISSYSEEDLFDIIEFIYDHVSEPVNGWHHDFYQCGWHYTIFDTTNGQKELIREINSILGDYKDGYELSQDGTIVSLIDNGFENLFTAVIPSNNSDIHTKIDHAINKFRQYKSSIDDRRDAIRELVDILEYLRPEAKKILTNKDDADLFNLANNFGIRHHNQRQQNLYNKPIWYNWLFYFYLATIHAVLRFIKTAESLSNSEKD